MPDTTDFIAQPAIYRPDVRYTGASSGLFDPGRQAEKVLGEIHWGELMGYCYRRFGPPNASSDPHKGLVDWTITTPVPDLFLAIIIRPHDTGLLFGYRLTEDLNRSLYDLEFKMQALRRAHLRQWCIDNKGSEPPTWAKQFRGFENFNTPEYREATAITRSWFDEYDASGAEDTIEVAGVEPLIEARQALKASLLDLKRPVYVRDVPITVHGRLSGWDTELPGAVPYHPYAGYYLPHQFIEDADAFSDLLTAVLKLGDGAAGVRKAAEILNNRQD